MHTSGSSIIRRALLADGVFCVAAGLLIAACTPWLEDKVAIPDRWMIFVAGLITAVWGGLLVVASRVYPTRQSLGFVATVNVMTVLVILGWLLLEGAEMTGTGIVVVGALGICVLRFAIYQSGLLRQ